MDQSIKDVLKMQMEYEALKDRLDEFAEKSDSVKKALGFRQELNELLDKHGFTQDDLKEMLQIQVPKPPQTRRRPVFAYKNPHTGERVETKGGNHVRLKEWRDQYGAEAVDSWKTRVSG